MTKNGAFGAGKVPKKVVLFSKKVPKKKPANPQHKKKTIRKSKEKITYGVHYPPPPMTPSLSAQISPHLISLC